MTAASPAPADRAADAGVSAADEDRRFGGLQRLYGQAGYRRLRAGRVMVVGLGGVGSWAVEALARSGVAHLVLVDLDHVAESNVNRQVQAETATLGMAKGEALARRIAGIHPGCRVDLVDEFVAPGTVDPLLAPYPVDLVIDACDDRPAKAGLAAWALDRGLPLLVCGAAGGKRRPQAVELADLRDTTHDPLLARLRQQLRKSRGLPVGAAFGLPCVFSREPVQGPVDPSGGACAVDGSLSCHGYGSAVTVTATFGLVAAAWAIERLVAGPAGADAVATPPCEILAAG